MKTMQYYVIGVAKLGYAICSSPYKTRQLAHANADALVRNKVADNVNLRVAPYASDAEAYADALKFKG